MEQRILIDANIMITAAFTSCIGMFLWYLKTLISTNRKNQDERIAKMEARLKDGEIRMNEIEKNYIARFEEVTASIHNTREVVLNAIGDLKETMLKNFVTKEDCRNAQEYHRS